MTSQFCQDLQKLICTGLLFVLSSGIQAEAYEEIAVPNGGTIRGSVRFVGELLPPQSFALSRYPDRVYCGALSDGSGVRHLRPVGVGEQGGLKDVIVTIEGIERGKPFSLSETKIETNICQFVPFVSVMREGYPLTVINLDSVAHDLQIYERDSDHIVIMFHRPALTKSGISDVIRFTGGRRGVTMQCGMHPYMQGHGLAVTNPYYAVTGLEGMFVIPDLPPGSYRVKAWHPILGEQGQNVTVNANGTVTADFVFEGK